jgi:TonB-dependent starch-binding outer membrane protein SusC
MRRSIMTLSPWLTSLVLVIAVGKTGPAAQVATGVALLPGQLAEGGPRFLVAAKESNTKDKQAPLDISRVPALKQRLDLNLRGVSVREAIIMIAREASLEIGFPDQLLPLDSRRVVLEARGITVAAAFTDVLLDAEIDVVFTDDGSAVLVRRPKGPAAGSINGKVTDAAGLPVKGASVSIEGTTIGALARDDGMYQIAQVPPGTHTLVARGIGYRPARRTVAIPDNDQVTVNFQLTIATTSLEKVVITGTPGATRVREIGHAVRSIDIEKELKDVPATNMQQLFQGREPGMVSIGTVGDAGASGLLVLRGMASLTLNNGPLIYVDGVRLNASQSALFQGAGGTGGPASSRLNDLNVEDIARVEIIKGASATTLYGSEASGGVIQIFTKRGARRPELAIHTELGANNMPRRFPLQHPDPKYPSANDLLTTGLVQNYALGLRGTAGNIAYFASSNYFQDNGSFPSNRVKRAGGRLNMSMNPMPTFSIDLSSLYQWSYTQLPPNNTNALGILLPLQFGNPYTSGTPEDPWGSRLGFPVNNALKFDHHESYNRFIGALTLDYQTLPSLRQRLTVGADIGSGNGVQYYPYGSVPTYPTGSKTERNGANVFANVDYVASWTAPVMAHVKSTLSVGGQLASQNNQTRTMTGTNFAIPGLETIGGSSTHTVGEIRTNSATGGVFLQEQVGLADRLFVTGGVRVDGSTSFGTNFGTQTYPKFGLSYIISDESWFDFSWVSSLKLRTAWGKAGKQPGAFDAVRTFTAARNGFGTVGLIQGNPGNAGLGPEVSTELEAGLDAELLNDRVQFRVTAYRQKTDGAILSLPSAPSGGFVGARLINAGAVENRGLESALDVTVLRRGNLEWGMMAAYAANSSKVLNIGGVESIVVDPAGISLRVGFPASARFFPVVIGYDANNLPIASADRRYIGPALAPITGSLASRVRWGPFNINANLQGAFGGYNHNTTAESRISLGTGEQYYRILIANNNDVNALELRQLRAMPRGYWTQKADWIKLREVIARYDVPSRFARGNPASVFVSGRNLGTWTNYPGVDPEVSSKFGNENTGCCIASGLQLGHDQNSTPQSRYVLVGMSLSLGMGRP